MPYRTKEKQKRRRKAIYDKKMAEDPEYRKRQLQYSRQFRKNHPEKTREYYEKAKAKDPEGMRKKVNEWRKKNKDKVQASDRKYLSTHPWAKTRRYIKKRLSAARKEKCSGRWRSYVGIKLLITTAELKDLWFRDKAYEMKEPSIDRKDSKGHYTKENCQYIEMELNRAKGFQSYIDGVFKKVNTCRIL